MDFKDIYNPELAQYVPNHPSPMNSKAFSTLWFPNSTPDFTHMCMRHRDANSPGLLAHSFGTPTNEELQ